MAPAFWGGAGLLLLTFSLSPKQSVVCGSPGLLCAEGSFSAFLPVFRGLLPPGKCRFPPYPGGLSPGFPEAFSRARGEGGAGAEPAPQTSPLAPGSLQPCCCRRDEPPSTGLELAASRSRNLSRLSRDKIPSVVNKCSANLVSYNRDLFTLQSEGDHGRD